MLNKKSNYRKKNRPEKAAMINGKVAAAAILCCGLSAVSLQVQAQANPVVVQVFFDAAGCPKYVDNPFFDLNSSRANDLKVQWTAVTLDPPPSDSTEAMAAPAYKIFFDPFVGGKPLESKNGIVDSPPINSKVPKNVTYKYTIMGDNCVGAPLDPYFRVQ